MALIDDYNSAKELWKNGTVLTKIFIAFSTFIACGSIASMSDTVFALKGFVLDGLNFYKSWVISPLQNVMEHFHLNVDVNEANFLILTSIFMSAVYRKIWVTSKPLGRSIHGSILLSGLLLLVKLNGTNDSLQNNYFYYLFLALFLFYPILRKFSAKERAAYHLPIFLALAIVLSAGAISAGLSR